MHYNVKLDGLRAIAALVVLAFHAKVPGFGGGFLGVDVFFVLSGYLITRILIEEYLRSGEIEIKDFFFRRLWRLYPALILLLLVYASLSSTLFPRIATTSHLQDTLLSAFYIGNYFWSSDTPSPILLHTWSLAVEMHFYLVWPILLLFILKLPYRQVLIIIASLWIAVTMWRWHWLAFNWSGNGWDAYYRTDTHASGLIIGAFIAVLKPVGNRVMGVVGISILTISIMLFSWKLESALLYGFTLAELGTALVITHTPRWLGVPLFAWLGKMSYGLYLWHYPVIRVMRDYEINWQITLVTAFLIGLLFSVISYYLLESPINRYRKRKYSIASD